MCGSAKIRRRHCTRTSKSRGNYIQTCHYCGGCFGVYLMPYLVASPTLPTREPVIDHVLGAIRSAARTMWVMEVIADELKKREQPSSVIEKVLVANF